MPLIYWSTLLDELKLKQYETLTKPGLIKLEKDGSNLIEWKEQVGKHDDATDLDALLCYGPEFIPEDGNPHPGHSIFTSERLFVDMHGKITLEQILMLSDEIWAGNKETENRKTDVCIFVSLEPCVLNFKHSQHRKSLPLCVTAS